MYNSTGKERQNHGPEKKDQILGAQTCVKVSIGIQVLFFFRSQTVYYSNSFLSFGQITVQNFSIYYLKAIWEAENPIFQISTGTGLKRVVQSRGLESDKPGFGSSFYHSLPV